MAVDTHIFRVCNRTGLAPGRKTPLAVEQALLKRVPARLPRCDAHHWLILHGRYVCQARRPCCRCAPSAAGGDAAPRRRRAPPDARPIHWGRPGTTRCPS
jgi:endonuclease-3